MIFKFIKLQFFINCKEKKKHSNNIFIKKIYILQKDVIKCRHDFIFILKNSINIPPIF